MKYFILTLFLILSAYSAQPATQANRWTTNDDAAFIDGSHLINLPLQSQDSVRQVQSFGAVCDGVTDDTAAINRGLEYFATNHGGTLVFPSGKIKFTQISIPQIPNQPSNSVTIRLEGSVPPAQAMFVVGSGGQTTGGTILKSTVTGSAGGAYFKAGPTMFNQVTVILKNLTMEVPPDPQMIGFDCRNAFALLTEGMVKVWTGIAPFDITTAPTHITAIGITTPANNNAAFTIIRNVSVCGFWCAYELSEHAYVDYADAWACIQSVNCPGGYHAVYINRMGDYHNQYGIGFTGFTTRIRVNQMNIERANSGWAMRLYDIYDPSNLGVGEVEWACVLGFVGNVHTFSVNGGANMQVREIGTPYGGGSITNITNVTNVVSGSSGLYSGNGTPAFTPTNAPSIYVSTNNGAIWYWYSGAWH